MLVYAGTCWCVGVLVYAGACWCVLVFAGICWYVLVYADVCRCMLFLSTLSSVLQLACTLPCCELPVLTSCRECRQMRLAHSLHCQIKHAL